MYILYCIQEHLERQKRGKRAVKEKARRMERAKSSERYTNIPVFESSLPHGQHIYIDVHIAPKISFKNQNLLTLYNTRQFPYRIKRKYLTFLR